MSDLESRLLELGVRPVAGHYRPLTDVQVADLEQLLHASLPPAYVEFLLRYGRCTFSHDVYVSSIDSDELPFLSFFGAEEAGRTDDLFCAMRHEREPDWLLEIADSEFGDPYVLDVRSERILYRDFYSRDGDLVEVAEDFSDLLLRLSQSET